MAPRMAAATDNRQSDRTRHSDIPTGPGFGHGHAARDDADFERRLERLQACAERLTQAQENFTALFSVDEKIALGPDLTLQQLMHIVEDAHLAWDHKRVSTSAGILQSKTEEWASRIHDHRNLLQFIPSNDKYVSVLIATFAILIKASTNHRTIGEAISYTFEDLHEDLNYWKRQMSVHGSNVYMRYYIVELYVIIYELFTSIFTDWSVSTWKRIKQSFDPLWLTRVVTERRRRIEQLKARLENEAKLSTERIIQQQVVTIDALREMLREHESRTKNELRAMMMELLSEVHPSTDTASRPSSSSSTRTQLYISEEPIDKLRAEYSSINPTIRDSIDLSFLSHLAGRDYQAFVIERCPPTLVTRAMKASLKSWFEGHDCQAIWIEGPGDAEAPSRNTALGVTLTSTMSSMSFPYISHFCTHMVQTSSMDEFYHSGLLGLVVDLCEQLGDIFLRSAPSWDAIDEIHQCIRWLKAYPSSITYAINVLTRLLEEAPPQLMCIVDNIHILENPGDPEHYELLQKIVGLLVRGNSSNSKDQYRVCFTTDGFSGTLGEQSQDNTIEHILQDRHIGADDELEFDEWREPPG